MKTKLKISLILNIIIIIFTILASIIMFTGFKFMAGNDIILESTNLGMLRFFTVDSNMLMGISALLFAINEIQIMIGKKNNISFNNYILKFMGTSAVSLTFFIVFAYLGPISKDGIPSMLMNSNLFFHLLIPVLSIITFTCFEKNNNLSIKHVFYGIFPTLLYGLYYTINVLLHMENGKISTTYDWYWFVQNGVWTSIIVVPIIFITSYIISLLLWKFNREII